MDQVTNIKIIPGVTDLSQIDLKLLVVMMQTLAMQAERDENCIKCELSRIEQENEELKIMQAEIARMEAEVKRRKSISLAQKVKELIDANTSQFRDPFGFMSRIEYDEENQVIKIELPNCNADWSKLAFNWAIAFCEKNQEFYPTHYENQSPKYLYVKLGRVREFKKSTCHKNK